MYLTDPVTIIFSVVACVVLATVLYGKKKKVHPNFPPGPPGLPIIGNMHMIDIKKPYLTFHELAKEYGSVYSLQIGPQKMVVLAGYKTVKDALVNHSDMFVDRPLLPFFKDFTKGNGILFSNGDKWKVMRRFTHSALREFGTGSATIEDKINEECRHLVNAFKAYKGRPFENTKNLNAGVANIISSIILGFRFEYEDPKFCRILAINNEIIKILGTLMVQLYNTFPSLIRWFPGSHKKAHPILYELHAFIRKTFTNRKKELDVNDQRSLIDLFLVKQKEEKPNLNVHFTDTNLAFLVSDLFGAGMDSTATILRWALLLMMKYPEIQKKVQSEIEKVIGSREPRLMHRKAMPYTDAVIHEILRFGNIAPTGVPRSAAQDVTFKGFFIPKGTVVITLLYSVLKDKEYFERPEEFYPQHFLDSMGNFVKNEAFLAFSAGKRSCIGENIAKMKLFLFFTTLLQNFTFQAPPGAKLDLTGDGGFATAPLKHEICAIPRN